MVTYFSLSAGRSRVCVAQSPPPFPLPRVGNQGKWNAFAIQYINCKLYWKFLFSTRLIIFGGSGANLEITASNCKLIEVWWGRCSGGVAAAWDTNQGRNTLFFFFNGNGGKCGKSCRPQKVL